MDKTLFSELLEKELYSGPGCGEAKAFAYATAMARKYAPGTIKRIMVEGSALFVIGVQSNILPNTGGARGGMLASALGAIGGEPSLGIELLSGVNEYTVRAAKGLVSAGKVSIRLAPGIDVPYPAIYLRATVETDLHTASVILRGGYSNIVYIEQDGAVLIDNQKEQPKTTQESLDWSWLNVESIYDYMDALKLLDGDKVARRWFIRKMRHCTDGLVGLDGKIDMEHIEQVENDQYHRTKISVEALSEEQKDILLDTCPEAAYEEEFRSASFMEQMPPEKPMKKLPPHVKRPKPSCKIIVRSCKDTLALIQKILPDFYEEASRKRTLDNCTVNVNIIYCEPDQWHLNACIIDNDYVLYSKHAQT